MKNMDSFHYTKEAITFTTKSTLFAFNKDEWDTKEDSGNSTPKSTFCIMWYDKKASLGLKWFWTVKKNQARSVYSYQVNVCLKVLLVSYSVSQKFQKNKVLQQTF